MRPQLPSHHTGERANPPVSLTPLGTLTLSGLDPDPAYSFDFTPESPVTLRVTLQPLNVVGQQAGFYEGLLC